MTEIDSWDQKLKAEYREQQGKRYNISHYVEEEKKQAREEVTEKKRGKSTYIFKVDRHGIEG